jgi:phage shock protein PspC (stress-responsive transcriptional regulator)
MQSLAKSDKSKQKLAKSGEKAKRKSEKVIGGVAAWVSNKTGINVVLLRLVLIGTLFASAGAAIIGYILVSLALTGTEKEEQPEF